MTILGDEQILYETRCAMFKNRPFSFILCVLLSFVGIGLVILLIWWLAVMGNRLIVTDRRTILRTGLLSKTTSEVPHKEVCNLKIDQSFWQRIFGVGTISISSAAEDGFEIIAEGMPNPEKVAEIIRQHQ